MDWDRPLFWNTCDMYNVTKWRKKAESSGSILWALLDEVMFSEVLKWCIKPKICQCLLSKIYPYLVYIALRKKYRQQSLHASSCEAWIIKEHLRKCIEPFEMWAYSWIMYTPRTWTTWTKTKANANYEKERNCISGSCA